MMAFGEDLNDVPVPLSDTEDDKVVKDILNCKEVKLAVGSEVLAIVNNVSVSRDRGQQRLIAGTMKLFVQKFDEHGKPRRLQ